MYCKNAKRWLGRSNSFLSSSTHGLLPVPFVTLFPKICIPGLSVVLLYPSLLTSFVLRSSFQCALKHIFPRNIYCSIQPPFPFIIVSRRFCFPFFYLVRPHYLLLFIVLHICTSGPRFCPCVSSEKSTFHCRTSDTALNQYIYMWKRNTFSTKSEVLQYRRRSFWYSLKIFTMLSSFVKCSRVKKDSPLGSSGEATYTYIID